MAQTTTGGIEFNFKARESKTEKPNAQEPFQMLVIGNFSGTEFEQRKDLPALHLRKRLNVDRDELDEAIAKLKPSLNVAREGQGNVPLSFNNLDDFHPDHIFEHLPFFKDLHALRRRLQSDNGFAAAAEELEILLNLPKKSVQPKTETAATKSAMPNNPAPGIPPSDGSFLDSVIGATTEESTESSTDRWLSQLIDDAVAPYTLPAEDPRKEHYLLLLDATISSVMSSILHNSKFQELEANWRGIDFLTRRLETDSKLSITLVDISQAELFEDLANQPNATDSGFFKLLNDRTAGEQSRGWSLVVGLQQFLPTKLDALMLGIIGKLCAQVDCPFVASADPLFAKCTDFFRQPDSDDWQQALPDDFNQVWPAIRALPQSSYVALTAPRFLLRYPYSDGTYSIESFQYEELSPAFKPGNLLWGNGALAVAAVIGQSFSQYGWDFELGQITQVNRLPLSYYEDEGEKHPIPCAETYLMERSFEALCQAGLAPLASLKNQDAIRIGPILSIHKDRHPLQGAW